MSDGDADDPAILDIPARVVRGAALLDEVRPGWADDIDRARLFLPSVIDDVLGQLFGSWFAGIAALWPGHEYGKHGGRIAAHGFDIARKNDPWGPLDAAWRAEIARRAGAVKEEVTT